MSRRACVSAWVAAGWLLAAGQTPAPSAVLRGVDHVPVAVRDLEAAGRAYQRLGFALKPGTPHANGIRNLHAKFPDGTEIELITAPKGVDTLTQTYADHLKQGDGPAWLSLHAPNQAAGNALLPKSHPLRSYVFFGGLNHSPTDKPEHFAHANTAYSLVSVWLAADDFTHERALLKAARVPIRETVVRVPEETRAEVAQFETSTLVMLPGRFQSVPGRRIVGATVAVRNLAAAERVLSASGIAVARSAQPESSLFLGPASAAGWTLELTQR